MQDFVPLTIGAVFHGRYRIVRRIKAGGMGAVYEVLDEKTDKRRALKVMLPSALDEPDFRARFEREAKITGSIESDHIVHVLDAGVDPETNTPFLIMELLRGEELASVVRRTGGLAPPEAVAYLFQTALGLDRTHAAGIIHRDLKPENLYLTHTDDGAPRIKILDFGIAKVLSPSGDGNTTRALGTPKYMAPEQIRGEKFIGARTDTYALGHIAYTMIVGEHYFAEEEVGASDSLYIFLAKIVAGPQESAVQRALRRRKVILPEAFDAWFFQAASLNVEERFERAGAAIAALAEVFSLPRTGTASGPYNAIALPPGSSRPPELALPLKGPPTVPQRPALRHGGMAEKVPITNNPTVPEPPPRGRLVMLEPPSVPDLALSDIARSMEPAAIAELHHIAEQADEHNKGWGNTVDGGAALSRRRIGLYLTAAIVLAGAVILIWGLVARFTGAPATSAAGAPSTTSDAALTSSASAEPGAPSAPEPEPSAAPTAGAGAASSGPKSTLKPQTGAAPAPTASAKPSASGIVDPWAPRPTASPTAAPTTKRKGL